MGIPTRRVRGGLTIQSSRAATATTTTRSATSPTSQALPTCTRLLGTRTPTPLTRSAAWCFAYDQNGNRYTATDGSDVTTYNYGADNRLEDITLPGGDRLEYWYDADGQRVRRRHKGSPNYNTYYVGGLVEVDTEGSTPTETRTHYSFGGLPVAVRTHEADEVIFVFTDHLGSVTSTWNDTTDILTLTRYFPYGGERHSSGEMPQDQRYTGQVSDATANASGGSGLLYYNARYYDPVTAQFTQPDTVAPSGTQPAALNRYSYVNGNPTNLSDPSGHCGRRGWGLAAAIVTFGQSCVLDFSIRFGIGTAKGLIKAGAAVARAISHPSETLDAAVDEISEAWDEDGLWGLVETFAVEPAKEIIRSCTPPGGSVDACGQTLGTAGALTAAAGVARRLLPSGTRTTASPDFVVGANGTVVSKSAARLVEGFNDAGFPSTPTASPGIAFTLPDGSLVRVMEPSGAGPLRAVFQDSNGTPINPFGPWQHPPAGLNAADRKLFTRNQWHLELDP